MANYLTTDTDLTSVASAIRTKGGTSAQLAFPAGFVQAIADIPTGGGGGYEEHTVTFTLASATSVEDILNTYVAECGIWMIYPTDSNNTSSGTIALGVWWKNGNTNPSTDYPFKGTVTATGVTLTPYVLQYVVNDVSYNATRVRANVSNKPAGDYALKYYGIAKT